MRNRGVVRPEQLRAISLGLSLAALAGAAAAAVGGQQGLTVLFLLLAAGGLGMSRGRTCGIFLLLATACGMVLSATSGWALLAAGSALLTAGVALPVMVRFDALATVVMMVTALGLGVTGAGLAGMEWEARFAPRPAVWSHGPVADCLGAPTLSRDALEAGVRDVYRREMTAFWRCLDAEVERYNRPLEGPIDPANRFARALNTAPEEFRRRLGKSCLRVLDRAVDRLRDLCPSGEMARAHHRHRSVLIRLRMRLMAMALPRFRPVGLNKRAILDQGAVFGPSAAPRCGSALHRKARAYWDVLQCAVPDLERRTRPGARGPGGSYVVDYLALHCSLPWVDPMPLAQKLDRCHRDAGAAAGRLPVRIHLMLSHDPRHLAAVERCYEAAERVNLSWLTMARDLYALHLVGKAPTEPLEGLLDTPHAYWTRMHCGALDRALVRSISEGRSAP